MQSNREGARMIQQGAVRLDGRPVTDPDQAVPAAAASAADASTAVASSFGVQVRGWVGERRVAREAAE